MAASFHFRTLSFRQDSRSSLAQFLLSDLKLVSCRRMQLAHRLRHTRRHMPLATPSNDVGDATCA